MRLVAFEPHAIKTEKTFASAQPKITILRLLNRDDVIWDTIPDCPGSVIQASDGAILLLTEAAPAQGSRDGCQQNQSRGQCVKTPSPGFRIVPHMHLRPAHGRSTERATFVLYLTKSRLAFIFRGFRTSTSRRDQFALMRARAIENRVAGARTSAPVQEMLVLTLD